MTIMRENFNPAGEVVWAKFSQEKPRFKETDRNSLSRAQKEGMRYERRAHEYLREIQATADRSASASTRSGESYELVLSPWIVFQSKSDQSFDSNSNGSSVRFCQPDAIFVSSKRPRVILIEIKYSHTNEAWRQLRLLYEPVLRKLFEPTFGSELEIACIELCRWFDPHEPFTEHFYYEENPLDARSGKLGIHIYRPRGRAKKAR